MKQSENDFLYNMIGVSGYEDNIIKKLYKEIVQFCDEIRIDGIGNLICLKRGINRQHIMIIAHIDEVGIQITKRKEENCYSFKVIGNVYAINLVNRFIEFENGAIGVILSDSLSLNKYEYDKLWLLIINHTELSPGDVGTFENNIRTFDEYTVGKGLDNRIGCSILMDIIKSENKPFYDTYFVFSVQEEIGLKGAKAASEIIKPYICICIDTSPVGTMNNIELSSSVTIKVSDGISISNRDLVTIIKDKCLKNNIPYQLEVNDCGGSEVAVIAQIEHPTAICGISIPAYNIHTAQTIIYNKNIENTLLLLKSVIKSEIPIDKFGKYDII